MEMRIPKMISDFKISYYDWRN